MAYSVEEHFVKAAPAVREVYDTVVRSAREFGPVEEDPKKTSIHLNRKSAFAAARIRRDFLILTLKSTADIKSDRISKREQISANRWYLETKLRTAADVDVEIKKWLREGYDLSG